MRKHAAMVFIPVRLVTVAEPPRISIEETMMLVASLEVLSKKSEGEATPELTQRT
jgi:hypothetical protein